MNGKLILSLSLFGIVMAFVALYIPTIAETFCWLVIFVLCARQIAKYAPKKPFINGFLVSVVNIGWQTGIRIWLMPVYMAHHPKEAAHYVKVYHDIGLQPAVMTLVLAPFIAAFYGLVLGLFATVATGLAADS